MGTQNSDNLCGKELKRLASVVETSCALAEDADLSSLLQRIVDSAAELTGAELGGLLVLNQENTGYEFFKVTGCSDKPEGFPTGNGILSIPYKEGIPLRLDDIRKHPRAVGTPPGHPEVQAFLGVPLHIRDKVLGSLFVGKRPGREAFSKEDENSLMAFAAQAALTIENTRLYERAKELARLQERKRLAQSLHETVVQYLFSIELEASRRLGPTEPCWRKLLTIQRLAERAGDELRSAIFALSSTLSANEKGLSAILKDLVQGFEETSGVQASMLLPPDLPETPPVINEAIYRIVSEALSNVRKHSQASAVVVTLSHDKSSVSIAIQDNGHGLDLRKKAGPHFGLLTMKEVANNAGGEITIANNKDDTGTVVRATFPLSKEKGVK